ncbi:MAG TPA: protein kinase [Candidatus Limnocylindrales bacterium]|nr:protein kinase [Candidatus Limnocylindrales bacterium]
MAGPTPSDNPLAPGQTLVSRFRIVRRIAQGGMGVVYEAYDEKLGRRIALKCARAAHADHLTPEVRLATEVNHPNICKIHEIHTAETPDGPIDFFTMEYLEGPTLAQQLRQARLPRAEAETIARQITAGLAEAHLHGIIHGDLKPANIILTRLTDGAPRAVITDFGLARQARAVSKTGGTAGYMAPELRAGLPNTVASDIYALGVVLYELATGYRPDQNAAMQASTVSLSATGADAMELSAAPRLRNRWDKVVRACLADEPARRPQSANAVLKALGPSALRRRALIAAASIALAAAAAFATYRQATVPAQSARLALMPIDGQPQLTAKTEEVLKLVKGTPKVAFTVSASRPTHRLVVTLQPHTAGKVSLHATVRDLQHSGAALLEWTASYEPWQLKFAPVAIAAIATRALHLQPLAAYTSAPAAYQAGAALLQDDSKLGEALADFQAAAAQDADSALPYAGMAEVQVRQFFLTSQDIWKQQAKASLEQSELRNSDVLEVHRIAGLLEYDQADPQESVDRLIRATEFSPPNGTAWRRLGNTYFQIGKLPQALQAYTEARRYAPADIRVYQDLANYYAGRGDLLEAARNLEIAVKLAPDRANLRRVLAARYQDLGRFADAEAQLNIALAHSQSAPLYIQLGHVLLYRERNRDALPFLEKGAALDPGTPFAWIYLGLALQSDGQASKARQAFTRGVSAAEHTVIQFPHSGYYHAVLAYLCAQTAANGRAAVEVAQAVQLSPKHSDTLYYAALTYERLGDRESALNVLKTGPRSLLEDLNRWPEAKQLAASDGFRQLLAK